MSVGLDFSEICAYVSFAALVIKKLVPVRKTTPGVRETLLVSKQRTAGGVRKRRRPTRFVV